MNQRQQRPVRGPNAVSRPSVMPQPQPQPQTAFQAVEQEGFLETPEPMPLVGAPTGPEDYVPPVPEPPPEEPQQPVESVAALVSRLNQAHRDLRRHQAAYTDLMRQYQSIGAAEDLQCIPLMPKWKSSDENEEMVEVGIDFAWIPPEQLKTTLEVFIGAVSNQFNESVFTINEVSGKLVKCLTNQTG